MRRGVACKNEDIEAIRGKIPLSGTRLLCLQLARFFVSSNHSPYPFSRKRSDLRSWRQRALKRTWKPCLYAQIAAGKLTAVLNFALPALSMGLLPDKEKRAGNPSHAGTLSICRVLQFRTHALFHFILYLLYNNVLQ